MYDANGNPELPPELSGLDDDALVIEIGERCMDVQHTLGSLLAGVGAFLCHFGCIVPALCVPHLLDEEASRGQGMGSVLSTWDDETRHLLESLSAEMIALDALIDERDKRMGLNKPRQYTPDEIVAGVLGFDPRTAGLGEAS